MILRVGRFQLNIYETHPQTISNSIDRGWILMSQSISWKSTIVFDFRIDWFVKDIIDFIMSNLTILLFNIMLICYATSPGRPGIRQSSAVCEHVNTNPRWHSNALFRHHCRSLIKFLGCRPVKVFHELVLLDLVGQ